MLQLMLQLESLLDNLSLMRFEGDIYLQKIFLKALQLIFYVINLIHLVVDVLPNKLCLDLISSGKKIRFYEKTC